MLSKDWNILFLFVFFFTVLYIAYYPPLSGIEDEIGFINQAIMWSHQKLSLPSPEIEGRFLGDMGKIGPHYVFVRNPFRSLTLLPFIWANQCDLLFYTSLAIHLLIVLVFALILRHLKITPLLSTLVLFHPTLSLYSRTIMADSLAAFFLLLAFYFLIKDFKLSPLWCGLCCGLAVLTRYHSAFALFFFFLYYLIWDQALNHYKKAFIVFFTGLFFIGLAFSYNYYLFQNIWGPTENIGSFGLSYIKENLGFYLLALLFIWPLMLFSPFFKINQYSRILTLLCLFYFLFFTTYYFHDSSTKLFETLVIGPRLLQVILPLWILSYVLFLSHHLSFRKYFKAALFIISVTLLFLTFKLFQHHQSHLQKLLEYKTIIAQTIPNNSTIMSTKTLIKLFGIPSDQNPIYTWSYYDLSNPNRDHLYQDILKQPFYLALLLKENNLHALGRINPFLKRNKLDLCKQHGNLYIFRSPHLNQRN